MNLARSQFGLKADLPEGFPYRFNNSLYSFSLPAPALNDFSAIYYPIFLKFAQMIDNDL